MEKHIFTLVVNFDVHLKSYNCKVNNLNKNNNCVVFDIKVEMSEDKKKFSCISLKFDVGL